jgi:heme/copper-type cytochrome/quinol oxidase subunit 1
MTPQALAIISLCGSGLNLTGLVLLFLFGLPFKVRTGGADWVLTRQVDEAARQMEFRSDVLQWIGFICVLVGTLLQMWVTAIQGGLL